MAERGLGSPGDNPKLADRAALMTRAAKRGIDRGELRQTWERQAADLGFSAGKVRANARKAEHELLAPNLFAGPGHAGGDAAAWAVDHLSERQAVFGHADLLAATLAREPGAVTVDAAERAIATLERDGGLHAARGLDHGRHWTTDAAMARESETIALMRAGQGAERTIMRGWIAETKLRKGRLNEGQKQAVKMALASKDRVIGVQGYAGTGKTTMLKRLRVLGESRGYRTMGLAPSASAANTLGNESGIESETLQRFLARHAGIVEGRGAPKGSRNLRAQFSKTIMVVDESSLASSEQMRGLLKAATALRVPRVVLVGDEKQLGAVEAGKPFAQLRRAGMQTVVMDEILRQRDAALREAVRAGLAGEVRTAFEKLGDRVVQVEREDLGAETALHWLNLPRHVRDATGVIAPTRALRDEINATIREGLIAEGAVSGPARRGEKLVSRGMTRAEMAVASNYRAGDTVIFNRPYKTIGIEAGDERTVTGISRTWGNVRLEDGKGNGVLWQPGRLAAAKGGVEVYRGEAMELRADDRVRWTRNDPGSGLVNGETAVVDSIERGGVRFRFDDGSVTRLADGDPQLRHLDRGWSATVHAFQGRTVDRIIAAMPTGNPQLTNQQAFYVAVSRARDRAELVTDDAWKLADQLEKATGERISALDGVAKQAAHEAVFGRDGSIERAGDRAPRGYSAASRGHGMERTADRERGHERRTGRGTGRVRSSTLPERSAGRDRRSRDSGERDSAIDRTAGRLRGLERDSEHEKAAEPKGKSVELDLGL